ncbi:MAG: shikimate kinase [Flavobacteriales bacterium]|nr:shikimate kinase [Flavobacteriales bacterium]
MGDVITLLGYMGSGKSTYGKLLAKRLDFDFVDLDDYIVSETGMEISDIFEIKGEDWFREFETNSLKKLINRDGLILSLGGGTPVQKGNMDLINESTKSIYLNASVDTLYLYLKHNRSKRPIIKGLSEVELKDFIDKHLSDRLPFYNEAILSVITDNKTIEEIVEEITWLIK